MLARIKHLFRPQNRGKLLGPWIVLNIVYDLLRIVIVTKIFGEYGVNGWWYGLYEVTFSAIFAFSTFVLIAAMVDNDTRRSVLAGAVSIISFFAPEAYVVAVSREVPPILYIGLGLFLLVSASITIRTLYRKTRKRQSEQ